LPFPDDEWGFLAQAGGALAQDDALPVDMTPETSDECAVPGRRAPRETKKSETKAERSNRRKCAAAVDRAAQFVQDFVKVRALARKREEDRARAEDALTERDIQVQQRLASLHDQKLQSSADAQERSRQRAALVAERRQRVEQEREDVVAQSIARTEAVQCRKIGIARRKEESAEERLADRWLRQTIAAQVMRQQERRRENRAAERVERHMERVRNLEAIRMRQAMLRKRNQRAVQLLMLSMRG
jgi:hypothetical protein